MPRAEVARRSIGGPSTGPAARALVARDAVNVTAVCDPSFSWMNNGKGQSPCVVAAWVQAACSNGGQWNVPPISGALQYPPPSTSGDFLANACTCVLRQDVYLTIPRYFPSDKGFTLPNETAIPYWAAQNQLTHCLVAASWPNAEFSATQAQSLAQQGHPDQTGASPTSSNSPSPTPSHGKSSPIGPIVGGVIGGLAVLLLALALFMWKRHQHPSKRPNPPPPESISSGYPATSSSPRPDMTHMRGPSDSSMGYLDPSRYSDVTPLHLTPPASVLPVSPQMTLVTPSGGRRNYPAMIAPTPSAPSSFAYQNTGFISPTSPTAHSSETHLPPSLGGSTTQVHAGFGALPTASNTADVLARRFSRATAAATAVGDPSNAGSSGASPPSQRGRINPPIYTSQPGSGEVQTMAPRALDDMDVKRKQIYMTVDGEAPAQSTDRKERVEFASAPQAANREEIIMPPAQQHAQVYEHAAGDADEEPEI
ncbi:hypothetical protein HWV62_21210 [Athelia sp. TMB]|nr:hypothetical protein HWV62_21210 [Athelia sp. TMB]